MLKVLCYQVRMISAFQQLTKIYRPGEVVTHQQEVTRLYRRSLKLLQSWAIAKDVINEEALKIRASFDKNKHLAPEAPYVL